MTSYIAIYCDARRKLTPIDSLNYTLSDAKNNHPSLKPFLNSNSNLLMGQILQSARILALCIRDLNDFDDANINEATVEFTRQSFKRAKSHLAYYIGEDTVNLFVKQMLDSALVNTLAS